LLVFCFFPPDFVNLYFCYCIFVCILEKHVSRNYILISNCISLLISNFISLLISNCISLLISNCINVLISNCINVLISNCINLLNSSNRRIS
jgi:hypothetical protein